MTATSGREPSRLETFSDAVFAFSATLLVVSLEVPQTYRELVAELHGFVAFGLSFAALILIWSVHHRFFRRFGLEDPTTIVLNAILLFVVLFYVYPLKFLATLFVERLLGLATPSGRPAIANLGELGSLFILYGAGFVTVFLCVALLYRHAYRRRTLLELGHDDVEEARFRCGHYLVYVAAGLLSVAVAWSGFGLRWGLPGWVYCLLGPGCAGHAVWRARWNARRAAA